jgi:hypothetical protein
MLDQKYIDGPCRPSDPMNVVLTRHCQPTDSTRHSTMNVNTNAFPSSSRQMAPLSPPPSPKSKSSPSTGTKRRGRARSKCKGPTHAHHHRQQQDVDDDDSPAGRRGSTTSIISLTSSSTSSSGSRGDNHEHKRHDPPTSNLPPSPPAESALSTHLADLARRHLGKDHRECHLDCAVKRCLLMDSRLGGNFVQGEAPRPGVAVSEAGG